MIKYRGSIFCMVLILAAVTAVAGQNTWDQFDVSGMPSAPTSFQEQMLFETIKGHKLGDRQDALRIQQKLARYYKERGDTIRALAAEKLAQAAAGEGGVSPAPTTGRNSGGATRFSPSSPGFQSAPRRGSTEFSGRFYTMSGRVLDTWDFNPDGTFYHTTISSGYGTSVRNGERGTFELKGEDLTLHVGKAITGYVTPGVGGRSTLVGGGSDAKEEVRHLKLKQVGDHAAQGIILNGQSLKVKSW